MVRETDEPIVLSGGRVKVIPRSNGIAIEFGDTFVDSRRLTHTDAVALRNWLCDRYAGSNV